jgi:5-methylcytosine-specific restriction endonuclease McrA
MVYVLSRNKKPLMPCTEKRARLLLVRGRARIHRMFPFAIRLTDRVVGATQPISLKIDPGSKATGIALVRQHVTRAHVLSLLELTHRGISISRALTARAALRRGRRSRNLRYRAPRFNNRRRPEGWLAPSLRHRVDTISAWVTRLCKLAPIAEIAEELVRFDIQLMQNAEISGIEYQHGTLAGYEVREYVFEKWGRQCVYCDTNVGPFNLDHLVAHARGGSNRVSNLAPSCIPCNQQKNNRNICDFLTHDLTRAERILKHAKAPLKDAACVNATRWALFRALSVTGKSVTVGTGGRTKWNRSRYALPKTHALDAVCVGVMDGISAVSGTQKPTLEVKCTGRGAYQRTRVTASGFPRGYLMRHKRVRNFATGDIIRATVPKGKYAGQHCGRVAVRASGSFDIQTPSGVAQGVSSKHCLLVQRNDGYHYYTRLLPGINARISVGVMR